MVVSASASRSTRSHGDRNQRWLSGAAAFAKAAAIHCVSEATREQAVRFGAARTKTRGDPAGGRRDLLRAAGRAGVREGAPNPSIGRLVWGKGHEYALVALAGLLERGVPAHLRFVGDGEDRDLDRRHRADRRLPATSETLGWLEPSDVVARLHSDVLLQRASSRAFRTSCSRRWPAVARRGHGRGGHAGGVVPTARGFPGGARDPAMVAALRHSGPARASAIGWGDWGVNASSRSSRSHIRFRG